MTGKTGVIREWSSKNFNMNKCKPNEVQFLEQKKNCKFLLLLRFNVGFPFPYSVYLGPG